MTIPDYSRLIALSVAAELAADVVGAPVRDPSELLRFMELRPGWVSVNGWPDVTDIDLLERLIGSPKELGEVYVVSDLSYGEGRGAFIVPPGGLEAFVDKYFEHFGEALFDGDVIVLSRDQKALWIFHHEAQMLQWRANQVSSLG